MRDEANHILDALDELVTIAREANVPAEIYHLKASGRRNWAKLEEVIERVQFARHQGLRVTADMYTYHASSTGLDATMPPWVQEGGRRAWIERLKDPAIRERVKQEMRLPTAEWDNGDTTTRRLLIRRVAPRGIVVQVPPEGRAVRTVPASERLAII